MAFQVNWLRTAQAQLAQLWLDAQDRERLTEAIAALDRMRRVAPHEYGEQRTGRLRLGVIDPVVVMVEVFDDDLRVDVVGIKPQR